MLKQLVSRRGIRQVIKDVDSFMGAVDEYLQERAASGVEQERMEAEKARFALLSKKIHFRHQPAVRVASLPEGARIKVWLSGRGLFSAEIEANTARGMWIGLPHWVLPSGLLSKKQELIVYYWDQHQDYEIHGYIARVVRKRPLRIFMPNSSTVFQGKHPRGMHVEARIPVFFQRILELDLPEDLKPPLHILQGTIVSLSIIGAEILTRVKGVAGSLYRFEFDPGDGGRRKHWFVGRVADSEKEGAGNRLFIRFMDVREETRELIERFVCRRVNRGAVLPVSAEDGRKQDTHP